MSKNLIIGVLKSHKTILICNPLTHPNFFKPPKMLILLLAVPRRCFFCGSFLLFVFHICLYYNPLSFPCSLVSTCWERADILALVCDVSGVFPFQYGVSGQAWYLLISIPDLCIIFTFHSRCPICTSWLIFNIILH